MTSDTRHRNQSPNDNHSENSQQTRIFSQDKRAQTSIDLGLAVLIFFSGISLIVVQSPGLFFPGALAITDDTATSDRIAIEITSELSDANDRTLSHDKVTEFLSPDAPNIEDVTTIPDEKTVGVIIETPIDGERDPPAALNPDNDNLDYSDEITADDGTYTVVKGNPDRATGTVVTLHRSLDDRRVTVTVIIS